MPWIHDCWYHLWHLHAMNILFLTTTPSLPNADFVCTYCSVQPESAYLVNRCWCIQVHLQIKLHNEKGKSVFCSRLTEAALTCAMQKLWCILQLGQVGKHKEYVLGKTQSVPVTLLLVDAAANHPTWLQGLQCDHLQVHGCIESNTDIGA